MSDDKRFPTGGALTHNEPASVPATLQPTVDAANRYLDAALSEQTRCCYAKDWQSFENWCREQTLAALPAAPATVVLYLTERAERGSRPASLTRYRSALRYYHLRHDRTTPSPTDDPAVRQLLAGIKREKGAAQVQKTATVVDLVEQFAALCPTTLAGKRDRALLLIGFAGAFRRSELVALTVDDIQRVPDGLDITIRRSKTDQAGLGQVIGIPNGQRLRPVAALDAWLSAAQITSGPLFRRVRKNDRVGTDALSAQTVAVIVKHYAKRLALNEADFSGHSLRAGFVTSAAQAGANMLKAAAQTRHKSLSMVKRYFDDADRFKSHAGDDFL